MDEVKGRFFLMQTFDRLKRILLLSIIKSGKHNGHSSLIQ